MTGSGIPGPLGIDAVEVLDTGTLCLWRTPAPGPVGMSLPAAKTDADSPWRLSVAHGFRPTQMVISSDGLALLKAVERLRLKPYDDLTGRETVSWVDGATIGYGHLIAPAEWDSYKHGIGHPAAEALLIADLARFEFAVGEVVNVGLQRNQFDALVIFAFNVGVSGLKTSSVVKLINNPDAETGYATLEDAWKAWNKRKGRVMSGLVSRRLCEWKVYSAAIYEGW